MRLLNYNEELIDAVVLRLQQQLPNYIAALNAMDQKDIQLEGDPIVYDYVPAIRELNRFPTFAVQDEAGGLDDDTGFAATGNYPLSIIVFDQAADQRTLAWSLRRYLRIVASIILDGRQLDPAWGVTCDGFVPGPTLGRPEEPREWMSYGGVGFQFRVEEYTP